MTEKTEAQVMKEVENYLKVLLGYGKLWYERMNAGVFGPHHNIQGARKGTADFIVIQPGELHLEYLGQTKGPVKKMSIVTFVECKSSTGKQKPEQVVFEAQVKDLYCRYEIVRSVDELQAVLE